MFESTVSVATRRCTCGACGNAINSGEKRVQVVMPWQKRGVNYHEECLNSYTADVKANGTTTIGSSENCKDHTVRISELDPLTFQYFIHYGMEKVEGRDGEVKAKYDNAESIGAIIKTAFARGAKVRVNGHSVKSVKTYDAMTKAVCMR